MEETKPACDRPQQLLRPDVHNEQLRGGITDQLHQVQGGS